MKLIVSRLGSKLPLMANMVEGGQTPLLTAEELKKIGYKIAIFPGGLVRAQTYATQKFFNKLLRDGSTSKWLDKMVDFHKLNEIIGTDDLLEKGKKYEGSKGQSK